jgi:hypothetical protein
MVVNSSTIIGWPVRERFKTKGLHRRPFRPPEKLGRDCSLMEKGPGIAARGLVFQSMRAACVSLFVARVEVVAGNGGRCESFRPRTVRAPTASRKTLSPLTPFERACAAIDLRLRSRDEGGQAIDAAGVCNDRLGLGLRLILRRRAMFAFTLALFAGLLLFTLKWLSFALATFAHIGLRLDRREAGLLSEIRETVTLIVAVITGDHIVSAGLQLRLVLAELLLRRRDQAEVVLGVLIVVLGGNRVAG